LTITQKLTELISGLVPNLFVKMAFSKLTNPQVRKLRDRELEILKTAHEEDFKFKSFNIKTYQWAGNNDSVLLIHGWEGQAGNFCDLIKKLQAQGFNIYAFDAPAHGFSSKGKTSFFEFMELAGVLIKKFNVSKLISHSFGGVATTYALYTNQDIKIDKYALITTPDKFIERIEDVTKQYGLHEKVVSRLVNKIETEYKINVYALSVSNFVKEISVNQAIIFHDINDRVIPIERSRNVYKNWGNATFQDVNGTGHFRILRDENVLDSIVKFIS